MYFWIIAVAIVVARGLLFILAWTGVGALVAIIGGLLGMKVSRNFHLGHDDLRWAILGALICVLIIMPLLFKLYEIYN